VPNAELTPSQYTLYAANRASLDVVGDYVILFVIDGHNFEADVSVFDKVDEFLLGSNWLEKYGAKWDFADGTVTLGDHCIKVHSRECLFKVRVRHMAYQHHPASHRHG